jgi:hypothetical protein
MAGNPINFTIENRTKVMADVQKTFMFNAVVTDPFKVAPRSSAPFGAEDLIVRCQSVGIPQVSIEEIVTNFMGTTQAFPGKKTQGGDVTLSFYDTEDQQMQRFFYEWHQRVFNMDPDNDLRAGGSLSPTKRGLTTDLLVIAYRYDKTPLPYMYKLYNCWIKSVGAPSFNFGGNEAATFEVTLRCDYWKLVVGPTNVDYTLGE